jgi:cysteinyl-tRNA synthetase
MSLRFYNTLSKKKETFTPLNENHVSIYVCGITAYDLSHVGHARAAIVFDALVRYLRYKGYEVTYARNYTDVDDKIIKRSQDEGVPASEIAERYIREFEKDMEALGVFTPDFQPRATQYIDEMIEAVKTLLEKGHAYQVNNDVYYAVETFPEYGKLSHRKPEELVAGSRVEVDERKRNPLDFALWKGAKTGEPWWESPWGKGRPGWHIECSVMSTSKLGMPLDIHGGGKDLIFPHHENEIAQAEGAYGKPFVRYWMHNGFVNINKEKMSKSLGNFLTIRDILKVHHPEVLRLFLLSKHYRSPLDYSPEIMTEMENSLSRVYQTLTRIDALLEKSPLVHLSETGLNDVENELAGKAKTLMDRFMEALDDDFNTARAVGYLFDLVTSMNRVLGPSDDVSKETTLACLAKARDELKRAAEVLGMLKQAPTDFFAFKKDKTLQDVLVDHAQIEKLVVERSQARREKNWARADEIREQLKKWNVLVEDRPDGTIWRVS